MSPNQEFIVSTGSEGGIFIWNMPKKVYEAKADSEMPEKVEEASQKGSKAQ